MYIVSTQLLPAAEHAMWELRASSHDKMVDIIQQIELAIEMAPMDGVETRRKNEHKHKEMVHRTHAIMSDLNHVDQSVIDFQIQRKKLKKQLCQVYQPVSEDLFKESTDSPESLPDMLNDIQNLSQDLQSTFMCTYTHIFNICINIDIFS